MVLRDIAKSFVISHFNIPEDFFDTAWDFIDANYDKIRSNVLSQHGKITQSAIPLGFVGETEAPVLKAILIFNTGFKQVNLTGDIGQNILASVQDACNQYMAETKLTREILERVKSGKNEIVSLLKGRQKIEEEKEKIKKKEVEKEKLEYVVFLSQPSGIKTFIDKDTKTESHVEKRYLQKKEKYDIFVYEQAVYKKVIDEGKTKMISLNPSISFRGLLILFLKYKDVHLPYVEMYHKAYCETAEYFKHATLPKHVMNTLKNAVNELKREFDNIKGFSIPRAKNSKYICEGDFKFCVIFKEDTNEQYTMLFEKFKVFEPISEEA